MHWQDVVIGLSYVFFDLALIPSLRTRDKPALQTSLITGTLNVAIALTQITLGLWFSTIATSINALLWLTLAYQKSKSRK
jgi:hypothetical protein